MRKYIFQIIAIVCMAILLVGCTTSSHMTYTFSLDNGDTIALRLDTTGGYKITSEVPFTISCDGEELSQGTFVSASTYADYVEVVNADENAELLDSGETNGSQWIFWCYGGSEYDFAILIADSDTAIVLGNTISEESARECFERLTISAED